MSLNICSSIIKQKKWVSNYTVPIVNLNLYEFYFSLSLHLNETNSQIQVLSMNRKRGLFFHNIFWEKITTDNKTECVRF